MKFEFDHLVQYTIDPIKLIPILKEKGLNAEEGGVHPGLGTHNVLSYFGLSYIEFIGIMNQEKFLSQQHPAHSLMDTLIKDNFQIGFSRIVVRTNNIETAANHFRANGFEVVGPIERSRKRPDGTPISWKLLYVGDNTDNLELPYIIQWDESDEKRKKELITSNDNPISKNEMEFLGVSFAVNDMNKTSENWAKWLGIDTIEESYIDKNIQAKCRRIILPGGNLTFCSPVGPGIVADVLETQGEKPFQANFVGSENASFYLSGARFNIEKR